MIKSFRHKGLKKFYETGSVAALDTSLDIGDMDIPGFKLHPLQGRLKGRWSVSVSGNWRITFEFREGIVYVLDYEDYH